jgi:hypothetical protein
MIACILLSSNSSSLLLLPRFGPRALIVTGMLLGGGAMAYLTLLTTTSSYAGKVLPALMGPGPGLRHDLRACHQHRQSRGGRAGLRRGLGVGQHDAAGWRVDRHCGTEHGSGVAFLLLPSRHRLQELRNAAAAHAAAGGLGPAEAEALTTSPGDAGR